jgi:hypothetical protein
MTRDDAEGTTETLAALCFVFEWGGEDCERLTGVYGSNKRKDKEQKKRILTKQKRERTKKRKKERKRCIPVLDGELDSDLQALPLRSTLGDIITDLLGVKTEGTDLRGKRGGGTDLTTDSAEADC